MEEDDLMPIRGQIGMVFQEGALFDSLTVGENVSYRLREQGELSEAEILETVLELLGFVGLAHAVDKMPSELSGGMRRRVAAITSLDELAELAKNVFKVHSPEELSIG